MGVGGQVGGCIFVPKSVLQLTSMASKNAQLLLFIKNVSGSQGNSFLTLMCHLFRMSKT